MVVFNLFATGLVQARPSGDELAHQLRINVVDIMVHTDSSGSKKTSSGFGFIIGKQHGQLTS